MPEPLEDMPQAKNSIDLTGSQGNAFALIGQARTFCRNLGWSKEKRTEIEEEMMAGDYEHLIAVFEKHFSDYCTLYR